MREIRWAYWALGATFCLLSAGCGAGKGGGGGTGLGTDTTGTGTDTSGGGFDLGGGLGDDSSIEVGGGGPCTGIACNVQSCPGGGHTSISGTVYAPNGTMPLYNVIVYVPNADLAPITHGATCDKCGTVASGSPITTTLTDSKGHFVLNDVPVGSNIPLVVQLGKWRRKISIPTVNACVDNPVTAPHEPRLPKNRTEGDMPKVAVTTGGCDQLSCMLPKVGIDSTEFGPAGSGKAVEFYNGSAGSGPTTHLASELWNSAATLKKYDLAIFSCECSEAPDSKNATSYAAVRDYLNAGGRIFTTDFQYTWYKFSPDPGLASIGNIPGGAPTGDNPVQLVTSFPKGKALADWLQVTAPGSPYGAVQCDYVFNNFSSADASKNQTWGISNETSDPFGGGGTGMHPRFMTINTPVGVPADSQCGKAVHLDAHINQTDRVDTTYPAGCSSPINQGELAFAFFFFDLSSCIQKEDAPPPKPPVK